MQIAVADLRAVTELLFSGLDALEIDCVEIAADYYWSIPPEEAYNPDNEPCDLDIGCMASDWEALRAVLTGADEPLPYHFARLAALLKAVGESRLEYSEE